MNIAELSIRNIERFGEYDSLYFEGRWFTNVEIDNRGQQVGSGLSEIGIKRGDRVAMVLGNCPEVLNIFYACFRMGALAMPVLFTLTGEEIGYVLKDSGAKAVITQKMFLDKVLEAKKSSPSVKEIVTVDPEPVEGAHFLQDWFKEMPADFPPVSCQPDDPAMLMYTSGTTGNPKGVMLSHNNLYSNAMGAARSQNMEEGEMGISALPLNHSYGIITNLAAAEYAAKGVMMTWFDATKMLELIDRFKCEATALVPAMLIQLLNHPEAERYDTSHMKRWFCAAAPLTVDQRKRFEDKFSGKVLEGYGLTECSPAVSINRLDEPYKDGSVGLPLEGVEVCIKDESGKVLPHGEIGEICVKGPNVMLGYYNRPEETAEVIKEGWFRTGDAGYLDEDGHLFLTERIKDLIIRGGENIFPKDIEEVLIRHPKVTEAAIIGMPHEIYGEVVMAVIVPAPDTKPTTEEIIKFCKERLGKFQVPQRVEFVMFLPKNPLGKVLKKDLRKQYFS
jgi:long-chain acyl-CoA synthetase